MKVLNLGCGTKTSSRPEVINIDWSMYLRLKRNPILRAVAPVLIGGERLRRFKSLPDNVLVHNLANGLPFDSDSVDVVYHSHLLEHLDRDVAKAFLSEARRVLRPGGIHRIVVPDFESASKAYLSHLSLCEVNPSEAEKHDDYIAALISQCVRREAYGTSQQRQLRRAVENVVLGDARRRGETHQWMYDRVTLTAILLSLGYRRAEVQSYTSSLIPNWNDFGLDLDETGSPHKRGSLYVEAIK
jgi:SAM-dependent methyltransferase